MAKQRVYTFSFLIFLLSIMLMLANQIFYRYYVLFNIGTNWRVIDVVTLTLFFVTFIPTIIQHKDTRLTKTHIHIYEKPKGEIYIFYSLAVYFLIVVVAIVRGFSSVGTYALGLGRYSFIEILLIPVILSIITSRERLKVLFKFVLLMLIPIWLFYFLTNIQSFLTGGRFGSGAATIFGLTNMSVVIFPFLSQTKKLKKSIFGTLPLGVILAISFFMSILAQVRSVWISFFIGTLFVFYMSLKKRNKVKIFLVIITLTFVLILSLYIVNSFFVTQLRQSFLSYLTTERLAFLRGLEEDSTGYWRYRGWIWVINDIMRKDPIFGVGFTGAGWIDWRSGKVIDVWEHNQYLHLFRATGIVGVISYLCFLATALIYALKTTSRVQSPFYNTIAIGCTGGLLMNIVYMFFYNQTSFLWINLGIMLAVSRLDIIDRLSLSETEPKILA